MDGNPLYPTLFNNQKMSVRLLREEVKTTFGIVVSMSPCRRAKKYALSLFEGTVVENYARIWSYCKDIKRSNLGSTIKIYVDAMPDGKNYFSKIYICFDALKQGCRGGCRRIINLDGCFMKSFSSNRKWFIENLFEDLQCWNEGSGLVLISDQHKGLVEAVKEVFPIAEHRQCARHIYANFRNKFSGVKFKNLFWRASKAKNAAHFNIVMKEIEKLNPKAVNHLMDKDPKTWSLVFFRVHNSSCESMENGFSESFNSVILDARKKPIIIMLEDIRIYVMQRIVSMKLIGQGWNRYSVCPNIKTRLSILQYDQRYWQVVSCGGMKFERRKMDESYIVDVTNKECNCRLWQLNGYGCVHSVATLAYLNIIPDGLYVDPLYLGAFFNNSYKQSISGMNGMDMWPSTDFIPPLPPLKRRMPSKPTMKRIRDACERSGKHMKGHNKTTCTQVLRPPKTNVTKKQKIMQTQESVNMQGGGEDAVMGDVVEP
ncbi:uncharacterized protein LOC111897504 [Lactuca sativa]|uniref:uncharacterized protein LOC111897504 n=1 Tax=Lactuca sativa TaxID=4236 RepID=UPI000CD8B6F0|nr:uncharacterized protein LOC111897504 [Lactuca sativa]